MNKKVLFIDPLSIDGRAAEGKAENKLPTPNLGIIYIATYLKSKTDADVLVVDMAANNLTIKRAEEKIRDFQPAIVGISSKTFNILTTYKLAQIVKQINPKAVVVVGGAHPTALPDHTLDECGHIDAVVEREGEVAMVELYNRRMGGYGNDEELFDNIDGVVWRNRAGQIVRNRHRELIEDLDSLPFPDLSFVDYSKYLRVYNPSRYSFQHIYPVFGSRGCPFNCTFCMPLHTRKHRVRSIDSILDEVQMLNSRYGAQWIYFEDSLFCSRSDWFESFCNEYINRGLHKKVQWGFETRIDTATEQMFNHARAAGCIYTFFGVESGSEEILKKANKKYKKMDIIEKIKAAKAASIDSVNISIVLGLPFETKQTIRETLELLEQLPCDGGGINILDIYPQTEVFRMADSGEGGLRWIENKRMNWSAYSRDEPMVEVNDLTSTDLILFREMAQKIMAKKSRINKYNLYRKRAAYVLELARHNRPKLVKYIRDTIRGHR